MSQQIQQTNRIPSASTSISRPLLRCRFVFIALTCAIAWLALSPAARAVDPPPDGGYPGANTAEGDQALFNLTGGSDNTAIGFDALVYNATGFRNTAVGSNALFSNTSGNSNTANGTGALFANTTGNLNTADGDSALISNTTGSFNIALGVSAGGNLTTGKNNIDIGNAGVAGESNKIRIGTTGIQKATFIAGISGVTVPSGVGVIVGTDGKLGTVVSSERYKDGIQPMDRALKPVTFHYKQELDPEGIPQFGLVAGEVEKVNPDLVARDEQGKPYSVRYEAVNVMLLNEFLKAHRKIEEQDCRAKEQEATIAQLKQDFRSKLAEQQNQIKALAAGLEKVSAQLELNKPAPQIVVNDR